MAKKNAPPIAEDTEQLSILIPASLKRQLKIAAINRGETVTAIIVRLIEADLGKPEGRKPGNG